MRAAVLLALVACAPSKPTGSCVEWADCGEGGACEYAAEHPDSPGAPKPVFECSFADTSCPSGRAFGEFASEGRRGTCVELSTGFDGLCDGLTNGCDPGLYCELGRCLSVRQLDGTGRLMTALCANDDRPGDGGDVYLWGIAFPFTGDTLFLPTALADAAPYATPNAHFESTAISAGEAHVCLVGNNEAAVRDSECFGDVVMNPAVTPQPPIDGDWGFATPGGTFTFIAAGKSHTCASVGRGVTCWGDNARGQLDGTGTATDVATIGLDATSIITKLSVGATFSCAGTLTDVWCWGDAQNWAVETFADPPGTRQPVVGLSQGEVTSLEAGETHVCAVKSGQLWCWGGNESGQASGEPSSLPVPPTRPLGDTPVLAVAAGRQHTCAVTAANQVMCWGGNAQNQLGSPTSATTPIAVPLAARAVLLAAGDDITCALTEDSWVTCWGAPELTTETGAFTESGDPILLDHFPLLCPDTF